MGPVRVWQLTLALAWAFACGEGHDLREPQGEADDAGGPEIPEAGQGDAGVLTPYVLCDGSDEVRFAVASGAGGLVNPAIVFTQPYGGSFLYITGRCEYLAGEDRVGGGLVTGTLDAAQASALEASLELARLSALRSDPQPGCDDSGHLVVATQLGYGYGGCGYEGVPDALVRIMKEAQQAQAALASSGTPPSRDLEVGGFIAAQNHARTFHPWPLALELASLALPPWRERSPYPETLPVQTLTGADADAVRALRRTDPERGLFRDAHFVEQDGAYYELYLLDVVPEHLDAAIRAFARTPHP